MKDEVNEHYIMRNFMDYTGHIVLLRQRNLGAYNGLSTWLGWSGKE
jgi:hypothetical protein